MKPLEYKITRDMGLVRVYPPNLPAMADREAYGTDLDESDLILLLADLQGNRVYDPDGTGDL